MSPAALEVRSPISSSKSNGPPLQNPDSVFHNHPGSPFNFESLSSGFAYAGQCGSSARSGSAAASGRSRPRFVKVRKQMGGRSRVSSSGELGSGFSNPFCSANEGGSGNVGFVFGANQSGYGEKKMEDGERKYGETVVKLSSDDENRKFDIGNGTESTKTGNNLGFVFGATGENAPESNVCRVRDDTRNEEKECGPECESFSDMGFVFSCDGSVKKPECVSTAEKETNAASSRYDSMSFLSGSHFRHSKSTSNFQNGEFGENFGQPGSCGSTKSETGMEAEQNENSESGLDYIFRTYCDVDLDSANLNSEKRESTESEKKPEFGTTLEKESDAASRGYDSMSSLFTSSIDSKSASSLQNGQFGEIFGQSGFYANTTAEIGKEDGAKKNNESGFVFGSSWFNSAAKTREEKSGSSGNLRKPVSNVRRKMKVRRDRGFQKLKGKSNVDYGLDKGNDIRASVCGSSSSTASTSAGCTAAAKCGDGLKLNSDSSGKYVFVFDSSDDIVSAASVHNLPDEMKRLNIDDSLNVEGTKKIKESLSKAKVSSETNEANSKGGSFHVEMSNEVNSEASGHHHCKLGTASNVADASGIPISEPFQTGLGENVDVGQRPHNQAASASPSFSSVGFEFRPNISEVNFGVKDNDKKFTWAPDGLGIPHVDFIASFCDPSSLKENLFPELNKKSECGVKNSSIKGKRLGKTKGKLKKSLGKQQHVSDQVPKESNSKESSDSPGCYSPMDFSPYQETTVFDQNSKEASADQDSASIPADLRGDNLATPREGLESSEGGHNCSSISGAEFAYFNSKVEQVCSCNGTDVASNGARVDFNLESEKQEKNSRVKFQFSSGLEDMNGNGFTFTATSEVQRIQSAKKLRRRRKSTTKFGQQSFVINPSPNIRFGSSSPQSSPFPNAPSLSEAAEKSEAGKQFNQGNNSSPSETYETCEKWRFRGNKAYKDKDLSKAEEFYTQGIISVPSHERSGCCLKPLVLCYSNRAATRMCLGKMREAIGDCMMATSLDPSFLKAQMRAANCHLVLGEVEDAIKYFNNCLEMGVGVCLDRRIIIDAADDLQKAQKVAEWTEISAKLLEKKNPDAALDALESISKALSISLYSEKLLEMKAEALHMLRRHEEVIQLCEQSLYFAEKNFISGNVVTDMNSSGNESFSPMKLWRWCLTSKAHFHLGRLEAALALHDKLISIKDKFQSKSLESSILLAGTIREMLHHKNAGNEAFKSGKYAEAVEYYTAALSNSIESRPFAAICFCNRAAAHQALGQIADAIADCSLAIALDGNYAKAVSRRATLHEMIRDYAQAATDLQRLISILKNRSDDKAKESRTPGTSTGSIKELRKAQLQLPVMEEEAKKGICLDFYLILGSKPSDTPADLKKAYHKAALKHHPDKVGQLLARSDDGDEGRLWKEISQEVKKDADRLFKMIGEAYAVLSDPAKHAEYDCEEEARKAMKRSNESRTQSRAPDFHRRPDSTRYSYERNAYRRNCRENWKTYEGFASSRW